MNEEIERLLQKMSNVKEPAMLLTRESRDSLFVYIINLQKRIKELEEINKQHQEINSELRTKIGKAIEYIEDKMELTKECPKDLLNILQDKEEV